MKKKAYRIFVFFVVLVLLIDVSISFENGNVVIHNGREAIGATDYYSYSKYTVNHSFVNRDEEYTSTIIYSAASPSASKRTVYSGCSQTDSGFILTGEVNVYPYELGGYYFSDSNSVRHITSGVKRSYSQVYNSGKSYEQTVYYYVYDSTKTEMVAARGNLITDNIISVKGVYPDDGIYSDGYWYKNISGIPRIDNTYPEQDCGYIKGVFIPAISVSDPDGGAITCQYYIDNSSVAADTKSALNTSTSQTVRFDALNIAALLDGEHTLRFLISDGVLQPVSKTIKFKVDNSAPKITAFNTASDARSINISVAAADSLSGLMTGKPYKYIVDNVSAEWPENMYSINNLSPNTKHKIAVQVTDNTGNVASTEERSVWTKAQPPPLTLGNIKENSMDIIFNDSNPTDTEYQLMVGSSCVNADGMLTSSNDKWIGLINKKITVIGLSPNTQYTIKARARNSDISNKAATEFSNSINGTTLAAPPSNITAEKSINSIKISWNAVNNATGYDIEADGKPIDTGTEGSYTHIGLQAETIHSYRVRTRNLSGAGPWSEEIKVSTLPNPPDTPAITNTQTTYSAITINWDAVAKATGYEIEADGNPVIRDSNTTSYYHEDLQPGTSHKYRIRAKNEGGPSEWSAYTEVWTLPLPPEKPANFKGVPTKNNITLTWSAADRAEGYELEIDGSTTPVAITAYTHDGLSANSTHTYKIRAYNSGGRSAWSEQTITTWPEVPAAPTNILATSEKDSITVTWYSSAFAEGYDIQVDGNNTVNVKELSYTQRALTPGTKHSYKLRAKNITGEGEWSNPIEISTLPEETATTSGAIALTNIAAVVTNKSVTIAWQATKANVQYQVEADGKILDNGKDTVYNHAGLKPQSFHTYRVRTVDADGNGQWCAILALSTLPDLPGAPSNVKATASDTQIKLSWTKEDGVAYEVEADGEVKGADEEAGYIDRGLNPGTSHTYRVRGKNSTGVTAWSDSITKSTTSPSYEVECKKDTAFDFSLLASNVDYFGGMSFVVTYNPEQLEVQDLYELTAKNEIASGKIPGTNLAVTYTPGRIIFSIDESVAPGANWSGEISTIVFKSKIDGKAGINYSIE